MSSIYSLRAFIRKSSAVIVCTGHPSGIILYDSKKNCIFDACLEKDVALKLYGLCCRYMEKYNSHIKHDISLVDFWPWESFVVQGGIK